MKVIRKGRRMRDYEAFGDAGSPKNALLIECGQHWEASAVTVARDTTARFLLLSGVVDESDLPEGWLQPLPREMNVVRVTQPVVADSMDFRFADAYTGLEVFPKAGSVIGVVQRTTRPYAVRRLHTRHAVAQAIASGRDRGAARQDRANRQSGLIPYVSINCGRTNSEGHQ